MVQTFANLPITIANAISEQLAKQPTNLWVARANQLHLRYQERDIKNEYVKDANDVLGYLALRSAATYAQIVGACLQVAELVPSFHPKTVLDLGSGPGTAIWATKNVWPSIEKAVAIEQNRHFIEMGKKILYSSELQIDTQWQQKNILQKIETEESYDVVIIANVLNELTEAQRKDLISSATKHCKGVLLITEPATSLGVSILESIAKDYHDMDAILAPYIANSVVIDKDTWVHFTQRFIRPEFQRRVRQKLRSSPLMASDWEETKFVYLAISKKKSEISAWGRCIGLTKVFTRFVVIPILTKEGIIITTVSKGQGKIYQYAKKIKWGELIPTNLLNR